MKHISKVDINRYIDNETDSKENIIIEEHIKLCSDCRQQISILKNLNNILQESPDAKADMYFTTRTMQRIKQIHQINPIFQFAIAAAAIVFTIISFTTGIYVSNSYYSAERELYDNVENYSFANSTFSDYSENSMSEMVMSIVE